MHFLLEAYRISVRRGCGLLMQSRTVYHWLSRRDDRAITLRIREIAEPGYDTVARVFKSSCNGKAGGLTTRKHIGFIAWKCLTCAKSAPAGMSVQHADIIARP